MEYEILKTEGRAKRARVSTVHGEIQTPVFMNVGTVAAIKGAVSTMDLKEIHTQVELSNTYHLDVYKRQPWQRVAVASARLLASPHVRLPVQ